MGKSFAVSQDLENIITDIAEVARILWKLGWAESNAGNISVNVTEHIPKDIRELNKFPSGEIDKSYPELLLPCQQFRELHRHKPPRT